MMDYPIDALERISKTLEYFASHGAPMDGVEEFIDTDYALLTSNTDPESIQKMKNSLRRVAFMGMGVGTGPRLPPYLKSKIASYAFSKGGKRRHRTKKYKKNSRRQTHKNRR